MAKIDLIKGETILHIIYISSLCTQSTFKKIFGKSQLKPGQQIQKYHRLIVEGLSKNDIKIVAISAPPITKKNYQKKFFIKKNETELGVLYSYNYILNISLFKNVIVFIDSFFRSLYFGLINEESIYMCDVLNISVTLGALLASKLIKRKSIGIITDLPEFLFIDSKTINIRVINFIISKLNGYVLLSEQMNQKINNINKPYIVIEGLVDINMNKSINIINEKYKNKVCTYAGILDKKYGLEILVKGFIKANIEDSELHLYGSGDYVNEIESICKIHKNVKYLGILMNEEVVNNEIKSTLLINPRFSNEEYTKYSFPSKNMEYMVSGTPVLTTLLPAMPKEYLSYVYLIEDETDFGVSNAIKKILSIDPSLLHMKGQDAKLFVLEFKNNVVQSKKIIKLCKEVLNAN